MIPNPPKRDVVPGANINFGDVMNLAEIVIAAG